MAVWLPDGLDDLDQAAADLAAMFADAELRLTRMLALQVQAGLAQDPDDMAKAIRLGELRAAAREIVASLEAATPEQVQAILDAAASDGNAAALRDMSALAGVTDLTTVTAPVGAFAAQSLVLELTGAITDVTRRILRWPDDIYREVIAGSATDVLLGLGATSRTAQATAWQRLVDQGVTGFVDKAGRRWNLATYVEMATRTATRRAWEAQHAQTMLDVGQELVTVVVGSDACQPCAQWAGKILRLTPGPVGRVQVPSAVSDEMVTVRIAGTVQDARDGGWQHPNCRCRTVAYLPGLSVPVDATTYNAELEAEREELRAMERDLRKAKAKQAGALNPADRKTAGTKVRALQGDIREHVDTTGLIRKRHREQLDLGNVNVTERGTRGLLEVGDRVTATPGTTRRGKAPTPPSFDHLEQAGLIAPPETPAVHYDYATERATALRLRMLGIRTASVRVQALDGAQTPDAVLVDARQAVEYKTIENPTLNATVTAVRNARRQSRRIVVDGVPSGLDRDTATEGLRSAVRSYGMDVDEVLILLSQGPALWWKHE